jgi:hypothetical protein
MVQAHGLAGTIRASEESDTFDLANQTVSTIASTIEIAFGTPFPYRTEMIRLTFVIGAGKQARQMYDPKAAHAVTSTLANHCGFVEDRGASCVMACAGTYKLQHDTGKNLKTVVVFPKIATTPSAAGDNKEDEGDGRVNQTRSPTKSNEPPLVALNSPEYKLAVATRSVFDTMIQSKCATWSQKRNCIAALDTIQEHIHSFDALLVQGKPLSDAQQDLYDAVSQLPEKRQAIHQAMQHQVEQGQVTAAELEVLKQQNAQRIAQLQQQGNSSNNNAMMMANAVQRKELLASITVPMALPKLKHHSTMGKLYKEIGPLFQLEMETKGRLLTVKETQALSRKEELEEEIMHLITISREWFEDDAMFKERVLTSRNEYLRFLPKGSSIKNSSRGVKNATRNNNNSSSSQRTMASYASMVGGGGGGGSGAKTTSIGATSTARVPVSKFIVPIKGTGAGKKKKKKLNKGDVFGAMTMDSDSEDEEEAEDHAADDEEEEEADEPGGNGIVATSSSNNTTATTSNKKKKKKKKGKKGQDDDDAHLTSIIAENAKLTQKKKADEKDEEGNANALVQVISFIQEYIWPLLVALLVWLIGLLFGTNKKKKRKNE